MILLTNPKNNRDGINDFLCSGDRYRRIVGTTWSDVSVVHVSQHDTIPVVSFLVEVVVEERGA